MTDLIDRNLLAGLVDVHGNVHWDDIAAMPGSDVQPVTPMHWIPINPYNGGWSAEWECSHCHGRVELGYVTDAMDYDYCPWCGAMDEGSE